MVHTLSPKHLAHAIGVSESSVKRWTDDGLLRATRTAGGHRRIALPEAVRFIRTLGAHVVHPASLGLADLHDARARDVLRAADTDTLHAALERGDGVAVRAIIQAMYLSGASVAHICDGPLRTCMARVGELWLHQEWGIVIEHRATDLCVQALSQLRWLLPLPGPDAPVALGGAADTDPYVLPSLMASTVACDTGFRDVNLGAATPLRVLAAAATRYAARLVWIALSSVHDPARLRDEFLSLAHALHASRIPLVVGGRALAELGPLHTPGLVPMHSMAEFAAYARGTTAPGGA